MKIKRRTLTTISAFILIQVFVISIALAQGSQHGVDPTYFEAKLKPHEETSFDLHVSPEAIAEALTASQARSIGSIYIEIPPELEEYIFWEPHDYENVMKDSDAFFEVFVFTPFDQEAPATIQIPITVWGDHEILGHTDVVLYIEPWDDVEHIDDPHGLYADPGEVAVTTAVATIGSLGAGLATGGVNSLLNVGRVDEGLKKGKKVKRSRVGQARTLLFSVLLIGGAYALVSAGTFSLGYLLQLPWSLPVIGSTLPVSYVSGVSVGLFLQALPAIFLSTGIVFLWRYILETITAKVLGIKIALVGNKIGAASLIGTTFLAHPYGFPMTTIFEGHVTVKDRGILSFMRNFGLLSLVAPLLYIQQKGLLGSSSFLVSTTGILIVLMTFFYTALPYKGEGIDLFKWNKGIDLLLIAVGLALYFGYKTSMISTDILMWASLGAAAVALIFILNLFRGRKQLIEDRKLESYRGNSMSAQN